MIVFDDIIADMINNKRQNSIVTVLFIGGRKLNISLVFITQLYFKVPKIPDKREFQQTALNYSSDISSIDFIKI